MRAMSVAPLEAIRPQSLYAIERSRRRTTLLGVITLLLSASLFALLFRGGARQTALAQDSGRSGTRHFLAAPATGTRPLTNTS